MVRSYFFKSIIIQKRKELNRTEWNISKYFGAKGNIMNKNVFWMCVCVLSQDKNIFITV